MHYLVAEANRTIAAHILWQPTHMGRQYSPPGDDIGDQQEYNSKRRHEYQEGSICLEEYQD